MPYHVNERGNAVFTPTPGSRAAILDGMRRKWATMPVMDANAHEIAKDTFVNVVRGAVQADPSKPNERISAAVSRAAEAAGFDGDALLADPSFRRKAEAIDPTDPEAIADAITGSIKANPGLMKSSGPTSDELSHDYIETHPPAPERQLTHQQQVAAQMREKAAQSIAMPAPDLLPN